LAIYWLLAIGGWQLAIGGYQTKVKSSKLNKYQKLKGYS